MTFDLPGSVPIIPLPLIILMTKSDNIKLDSDSLGHNEIDLVLHFVQENALEFGEFIKQSLRLSFWDDYLADAGVFWF